MTFGSLFSGIGGLDLGLERAGMECRWQVEIDPYCNKVLEKHWPDVKRYGDICGIRGDELEPVDLVCGGFPCQDLSQAGKRAGIEGSRSGLWFEYARLIGVLRPRFVLIENVPGLLVPGAMSRVVGELARLGYVGIWRSLRASEFGASHLRKRVFIVAFSDGARPQSVRSGRPAATNAAGADVAYRDNGRREGERSGGLFDGERTPRRNDVNGRDPHVAHANKERQSRLPFGTEQAYSGTGISGFAGCGTLADSQRTGLEVGDGQREQHLRQDVVSGQRNACGDGNLPRFAPGPSDPRWPAILNLRPDLAPALANPVRRYHPRSGSARRGIDGPDGGAGEIREPLGAGGAGDEGHGSAPPQPALRGVVDGLSDLLDGAMRNRTKRLGRLGNAVVPQVAEWIGERILAFEGGN